MQLRSRFFLRNDPRHFSIEHCMRGIVEGTQHAGYVAQRRVLDAALSDRPPRIAFEIDEDKILTREEHLAEMHVAVNARADGRDAMVAQGFESRTQFVLSAEQLLSVAANIIR